MPIEKGADWGARGRLPLDAPWAEGDAQLGDLAGAGVKLMGLRAGDLARTLGIGPASPRDEQSLLLPIDVVEVMLDDGPRVVCAAHTVIGDLQRSRGAVAIMNSAFIGELNIAPRAHPGDGLVDIVAFDLGLTDRFKARRRMPTGTHVPHPGITISRRSSGVLEFARPRAIRVDGRRLGRASRVEYLVRSAALTVGV